MNADESRNALARQMHTGPEQILENSNEFELEFFQFDKHRMSNMTPIEVGRDEYILQATSNLD